MREIKPRYLNISKRDFKERIEKLFENLKNCRICPHKCKVNRIKNEKGFCRLGHKPMISSFSPHYGEETVLVGINGSGTIFFSSCNLACVYCQNHEISKLQKGNEISFSELADIMLNLQNKGCHNINLVTPTPQIPAILKSLQIAIQKGLRIPIVYNTGGYDSVNTLKLLDGIVDIYMPDIKYFSDSKAKKYSLVKNYSKIIQKALKEMHRQVGDLFVNQEGIAIRGLLIRHLILPNNLGDTKKILKFISEEISPNTFVNLMGQYHPCYKASEYSELNRCVTQEEFDSFYKYALKKRLNRLYN